MDYMDEELAERLELAGGRLLEISQEKWDSDELSCFKKYFDSVAEFLVYTYDLLLTRDVSDGFDMLSTEQLQEINHRLYEDILPENYSKSYANPEYAALCLGEYGSFFSAVYAELRSQIVYAYEEQYDMYVANLELFLELYSMWSEAYGEALSAENKTFSLPDLTYIKEAYYYHMYDYAQQLIGRRIRASIDCSADTFAYDIIMNSDLNDIRYLYRYGEYITENEIKTAEFLNTLSDEEIHSMAATYVGGFVEGFKTMRIDLAPKKTVNIRYAIGQERMVKEAVLLFKEHGLSPIITRYAISRANRKLNIRTGYTATAANKQYEYDHRMDEALFFDKRFANRKLEIIEEVYEKNRELAHSFAGPAVIETFGEKPFEPKACEAAITLNENQQKLSVNIANKTAEITNRYIPRDKYSFTIIAYPVPEIGDRFEEIFADTVKVNTLDNELYRNIQQIIIDELDKSEYIHVIGYGDNKTDIKVMLHQIDCAKETNFENCVADVNIPVGEVFTSPVLKGTNGILNVSSAYLNELKYTNLMIEFKDGKMYRFSCDNFESEEKNQSFIRENLMFNHDTLPIGEFAIGTNTIAYVMARKYDILSKLPILIVEKTGPHFAVGDTCYSYSEEARLYNPDGREIVAKENECSLLRHSEVPEEREKAYFNCHTDITIPYEEIEGIYSVHKDGSRVAVIKNGRFVLEGTEKLNEAFEQGS